MRELMTAGRRVRLVVAALAGFGLLGCQYTRDDSGLFIDARDDYLDARPSAPLAVPQNLSGVRVDDTWPIPELANPNIAADMYPNKVPRPEVLVGREFDAVRIQRLRDKSWIVLGDSPEQVWPLVKQFLADNGVGIGREDPPEGVIESEWFVVREQAYADVVRSAIQEGRANHVDEGGSAVEPGRDRLRLRVERGIRRGSSEVHLSHLRAIGMAERPSAPIVEVERAVIGKLAEFLAHGVTNAAVSMVGRGIAARSKAEVIKDRTGYPALHLHIGFDRAWATVSQALERAEVVVHGSDVATASVQAEFPTAGRRGWLQRVVPGGETGENAQVVIRVHRDGDARTVVSVEGLDGSPTDADLAEEVLVTIRAFAA